MAWLAFVLLTVATWGVYGIFLHQGQIGMADPVNGRYKAVILLNAGSAWSFPAKGVTWSLLAGLAGAIGAFGVLLAFGAKGTPPVVMSIIFAGAPVVNAIVALTWHPPAGGLGSLRWQFIAGILLAALGGCLVTLYKPPPAAAHPPAAASSTAAADAADS
jgi:drug/metabolite transporter (DMT)-like permease